MPLTGAAIAAEWRAGRITITPFTDAAIMPNSYRVTLADEVITLPEPVLDVARQSQAIAQRIPSGGLRLEPGRIVLAHTRETIGSAEFAMTLDALPDVSDLGIWIHFDASLGHIGAVIPWTLELAVVHPMMIYADMPIGGVAFWPPLGVLKQYRGRYAGSTGVVASLLTEGPLP
jgi:dCTP deaminase